MNGKPDNERLSALLDGELTAEERASLEGELTSSPELQHELAELQRVSSAVKNLPQIPAPASLHTAVMAEIQQTVRPGQNHPTGSERAGGRLGLARLAGLSAAIALAVGTVIWFDQDRDPHIADNRPEIISVQQNRTEAMANRAEFRRSPDKSSGSAAAERPPGEGTVSVETRHRVLQVSRDDLTAARVGDIVEAVDANGDVVGVIRLTVVDRKQGVEALQVLLTAQQFVTVDGSRTSADADQSGLVAVYVESDREKLSQAIAEFRRQLEFGSLEVESPVRVAELEPEIRDELGLDQSDESTTASQRAVALKPGSQLDRLAQPATATAVSSETGNGESATEETRDSSKPVRVIFVVVDDPVVGREPAPKENGAA